MDTLKKLFPQAVKVKPEDAASLVIAILLYIVFGAVAVAIIGWLTAIPYVGFIFGLIGTLVGIYSVAGIVISVLVFCKVLQ